MAGKPKTSRLGDLDLLNTREVCEFLGIDRTTLYRIIGRGELKARRIGRGYKVLKQNLLKYLGGE